MSKPPRPCLVVRGRTACAAAFILLISLILLGRARAQAAPEESGGHGRILLVLPFNNNSGQPSLEWIREAAANILNSRFTSAGFAPLTRADRLYALDHLGLPAGFQPSRASSIKLAQTIDADFIIVGSFTTDAGQITAQASIVDVPHLRMGAPLTASGQLPHLIDVFDALAWKLTREIDPGFTGSEQTFLAAGANLQLNAFEQYIRGITEPDQAERMRHLQAAVKLSPRFSAAWMAIGRQDYASQQYDQAAAAFAKVSGNDADALEAGFYRGLSLIFSGDYARAETAFASVARVLPLAPVLNNEGVAISRQGHDGTAMFRQAAAADPDVADYHFNLAVSLAHHGQKAAAESELEKTLKLRPTDSEAQSLLSAWKQPSAPNEVDPLERIERGFDAVAFRQAAVMINQMENARLTALSPDQRARALAAKARDYLSRGLMLEAEHLYQESVSADSQIADGHLGLAEVRERTGDAAGARAEAQKAIELAPSADAYLVLARLDLAARSYPQARQDVQQALRLRPGDKNAAELMRQITAGEAKPR
ncbi:MAG: tetratricopeptide repeat protein [Acidobacteriota bacterium]